MTMNQEQQKLIKYYLDSLMSSPEFRQDLASRHESREFVANLLKKENVKSLTEFEFGKLISGLWASAMWGNKDYLVQKIIDANGLDKIIKELDNLLYGSGPFEKRFDRVLKEIKELGPATITEILCLYDPDQFGVWNDKARKALKTLKFDSLPLQKYNISGKEYTEINKVLIEITSYLGKEIKDSDLLAVDYFLYEIWEKPEPKPEDFDHEVIKEFVRDIGMQLGFEVNTEESIAPGTRVDCIWRVRIANLGMVTYVFEVHKKGAIKSLIVNLLKALDNPTVQRIVAVSDADRLEKIREEIEGLPENFRKSLAFWEVDDVTRTHEKLSEVMESISKLSLVKSQFWRSDEMER